MKWAVPALLILTITVAGCSFPANYSSIFRTDTLSSKETTQTTLIDAKQRALFAVPGGFTEYDQTRDYVICAEPSPDTVSSLSSAFSASLGGGIFGADSGSLGLATALSEAVGELGKRNATIQLLRDSLYRQCEAFMNGMIDGTDYEDISHRYVDAMVTLLAIEQVTSPSTGNNGLVLLPGDAKTTISGSMREKPNSAGGTDDLGEEEPGTSAEDAESDEGQSQPEADLQVEASIKNARSENRSASLVTSSIDKDVAKEVTEMLHIFLEKNLRDRCLTRMDNLLDDYSDSRRPGERSDDIIYTFLNICRDIFKDDRNTHLIQKSALQ